MTWQGTGTSISGGVSEDATQLCTLAQVKRALGVSDSDTDDDDALVQIIQQVSAQMEGLGGANRRMTEHTLSYAYFDVPHAGCDILYAPAWPIVSCGAVVEAADNAWASGTTLVVDTDYYLDSDRGRLIRVGSWLTGRRSVRAASLKAGYVSPVTSSAGGFALASGQVLMPADVVGAAIAQAVHAFNKRIDPAAVGQSAGGASLSDSAVVLAGDLLPGVAAVMKRYRRLLP
ncbi:MAG: hypothetical protein BWX88_02759 [Planctomycetes bacterium ADurb.Bin126]|nr:MAG: hypothetical protein BWX88_02759 [Planctomycetes bacterium ADurb.Bin126]HOD79956.1 hypothetical protein [Phycisphaerae bacterium]HQL73229.1 hypothetical protein [Phycisphaerae bacterium]